MEKVQEYLMSKGIRPSPQRIAIMNYLLDNCNHPTVEAVYDALHTSMPTLSKTTVYNTLKLFEEKKVVQLLNIDERNVRLDATMEPHAHFQCMRCGKIFDVSVKNGGKMAELLRMNEMTGFEVQQTQIYYKGICPHCQSEKE
ncbi:MAG: transcriptional repressor [Bacteroidales bacterium]|nr:transcriptional repressor [Bacteroidales bacterium]